MRQLQGYGRGVDRLLPEHVPHDYPLANLSGHRFPLSKWEGFLPVDSLDLGALEALIRHRDAVRDAPEAPSDQAKNELDAWLSPRLHAALRIPRRIAGSREFWRWIALDIGRPLIQERFGQNGKVRSWRFTGLPLRNGMARLWWAAEMVRNGSDYRAVPSVFGRTRTAQFALELAYSQYKPAAIAFVRVAEGLDGGFVLSDSQMNRLSKTANALLSTRVLEVCDSGVPAPDLDEEWLSTVADPEALVRDELPVGPDDGLVSEDAIVMLATWFRNLSSTQDVGSVSFRCPELQAQTASVLRRTPDPARAEATSSEQSAALDFYESLPEESLDVDENDRYREFPLPESWLPVLADFAPARVSTLGTTQLDHTRVFKAFLDSDLGPRRQRILLWRFLGGRTLEQIGSRLGLTRERVRQLQKKALSRVQASIQAEAASESDLLHVLERLENDGVVISKATSRTRLTSALAVELLSGQGLFVQEHAGYVLVAKHGFNRVVTEVEQEVASMREFATQERLALALGVKPTTVEAAVYVSDRLYLDCMSRVGTRAWNKVEMMEVVAWILALSGLEVMSWHASELVEALKIIFPDRFADWRARHAFAALSRKDVHSFAHVGRLGRWALSEAISGPGSTVLAVAQLLESSVSPLHIDEIHEILIGQGREVRRESLAALLSTNSRFFSAGKGCFGMR